MPERTCGRMIIDLIEPEGGGRPTPRVSFDPVGRFTPGHISEDWIPFYAAAINRAQNDARNAAPVALSPRRRAR